MDESEVEKLTRAEARAQLIVTEQATALFEAEEHVETLKRQLRVSTSDLKAIRKELMAGRVSYGTKA